MGPPGTGLTRETTEHDLREQISFARHNFDNLQSLVRLSDAKAGALVTIVIFLASGLYSTGREVLPHLTWTSTWGIYVLSTAFVASLFMFLITFGSVVWITQRVLRPRGARHYGTSQSHSERIMWQEHITAHATPHNYFDAVRTADANLILKNTTDQIFELASISEEKMAALRRLGPMLWFAFGTWATALLLGLYLGRH